MGHVAIDNTPYLYSTLLALKEVRERIWNRKLVDELKGNTASSPSRFSGMVYRRKEQDEPMSAGQSLGRAGLRVGRLPAHKHDYKPFIFGPLSSLQTISLPCERL